jgi:hypothetical protein
MLRLDRVLKPWKESGALNDHINLYGFWNETTFLTKSGDVGMVLSISGVDYESLDRSEQEYAIKRLEAALKAFGPGFHVYQYLFKSNRPDIPFSTCDDPVVNAAIDQRRKFFEAKRDHLYRVEIFYSVLLEGARAKTGVGTAFARLLCDPAGAVNELRAQFTNDSMKTLLSTHIEHDVRRLDQHVQAFSRQLADFTQIEVLDQRGQFTFFRRLLNYDDWRVAGRPKSTQFLDYQVVNSDVEAERDCLRVGGHLVRILTMKEAITETHPLVLDALLKVPANFYVVTEWTPLPADKARKEVNKRRRHFNMSKTGFVSQMGNDATRTNPRDVLVDESKQADIENLGDCLRAQGHWGCIRIGNNSRSGTFLPLPLTGAMKKAQSLGKNSSHRCDTKRITCLLSDNRRPGPPLAFSRQMDLLAQLGGTNDSLCVCGTKNPRNPNSPASPRTKAGIAETRYLKERASDPDNKGT